MYAHRRKSNHQRDGCGGEEQPGLEVDVIGEAMQPAVHGDGGHGPGDQVRPQHRLAELPRNMTIRCRRLDWLTL